jgi:hypothetical protein
VNLENMIDLKSLIKKSVRCRRTDKKIKEIMTLSLFSQAVEKFFNQDIYKKIKPLYFKDDSLIVASLSEAVVREVMSKESQIIDYINSNLEYNLVKKINYLT